MAEVRFQAVVVDIREQGRLAGRQRFQVLLDRTEFQAGELGRLEAVGRSGARLCAEVFGVIQDENGDVWHVVEKPLAAETAVTGSVERTPKLP